MVWETEGKNEARAYFPRLAHNFYGTLTWGDWNSRYLDEAQDKKLKLKQQQLERWTRWICFCYPYKGFKYSSSRDMSNPSGFLKVHPGRKAKKLFPSVTETEHLT